MKEKNERKKSFQSNMYSKAKQYVSNGQVIYKNVIKSLRNQELIMLKIELPNIFFLMT